MRIQGVELNNNKLVWIGLTAVYGVGICIAKQICHACGVDLTKRIKHLSAQEVQHIKSQMNHLTIEGELRRKVVKDINKLVNLGTYRGTRHKKHLPTRGQRTRTNAKTCRKTGIKLGNKQ